MPRFQPSRSDGRSDVRVVLDLMSTAEPGTLFTYGDLKVALEADTDREFTDRMIGAACRAAAKKGLAEYQRTITSVPTVGYRLAKAGEQRGIALVHHHKADNQMAIALRTLQHVRWDEMDEQNRLAHEAQLAISGGIWQALQGMRATQRRHERAIRDLTKGKATGAA